MRRCALLAGLMLLLFLGIIGSALMYDDSLYVPGAIANILNSTRLNMTIDGRIGMILGVYWTNDSYAIISNPGFNSGNVNVTGALHAPNMTLTGSIIAKNANVTGNLSVGGNFIFYRMVGNSVIGQWWNDTEMVEGNLSGYVL